MKKWKLGEFSHFLFKTILESSIELKVSTKNWNTIKEALPE